MGDLPNLPPGWGAIDANTVQCPDGRIVPMGWVDPDALWSAYDATVRAAITDAATAAGVVLPKEFDVGAVLRDGVRAHGWWWRSGRPMPDGRAAWDLWMGEHRFAGFIVDGGTWSGSDAGGGVAPSNEAAAVALWEAVGPEGLPMPPLPGWGS